MIPTITTAFIYILAIAEGQVQNVSDPLIALTETLQGVPKKDYPIYSEPPSTGFSCESRIHGGIYSDPETECQVFHVCETYSDRTLKYSFLCPNGTIFNQEYLICDWWFNFDCSEAETFYNQQESNITRTFPNLINITRSASNKINITRSAFDTKQISSKASNEINIMRISSSGNVNGSTSVSNETDRASNAVNITSAASESFDFLGPSSNAIKITSSASGSIDSLEPSSNAVNIPSAASYTIDSLGPSSNAINIPNTASESMDSLGPSSNTINIPSAASESMDSLGPSSNAVNIPNAASYTIDSLGPSSNAINIPSAASDTMKSPMPSSNTSKIKNSTFNNILSSAASNNIKKTTFPPLLSIDLGPSSENTLTTESLIDVTPPFQVNFNLLTERTISRPFTSNETFISNKSP